MEFQDTKEIQYILREIRDFEESLLVRDELLLAVLRFHLVVENLLERFMAAKMPRGNVLAEEGRLSFAQKLAVVDAFGILESNLVDALRQLNALRNACAHKKGRKVSLVDLDRIGKPLGVELSTAKPDPDETIVNEFGLTAALFGNIHRRIHGHLFPLEYEGETGEKGLTT